jgi:cell division septum initiation protein DivIVA
MSETCAVCKQGKDQVKCEKCGFTDNGVTNREFLTIEDANHWLNTVVIPYRMQYQFEKERSQNSKLKNQIKKMRKEITELKSQLDESQKREVIIQPQPLDVKKDTQNTAISNDPRVGTIIQFGNYKWRVLDVQSDRALILTEDIIEKRKYNEEFTNVTWEECTLRKYLNDEFLQKFTKEQQRQIIETEISNPDNLWYGTEGGRDTKDKIFLLSLEEADRYFGDSGDYYKEKRRKRDVNGKYIAAANDGYSFSNTHDIERQAKYNNEACWWWLRSPGCSTSYAAGVITGGDVGVDGCGVNPSSFYFLGRSLGVGVRPALWLKL